MIPYFPQFKPVEIEDREEIMRHTSQFLPYSDFNFISMWSWDTDYEFKICTLNGNLVVRFVDYISGDPFLSFIGNNKVHQTIDTLLKYADEMQISTSLRLIPEDVVKDILHKKIEFIITEDRDSFDYILSVEQMNGFKGNKLRGKRNFVHRCEKMYNPNFELLNINNPQVRKEVLGVAKDWMEERMGKGETPNAKEFAAISKLLHSKEIPNIITIGVYIRGRLEAFVIGEDLKNGYAILHFEKARSNSLVGIYAYLMHAFAVTIKQYGCELINHEQDLGLPGLRTHKESLTPRFAKKYIITGPKNG